MLVAGSPRGGRKPVLSSLRLSALWASGPGGLAGFHPRSRGGCCLWAAGLAPARGSGSRPAVPGNGPANPPPPASVLGPQARPRACAGRAVGGKVNPGETRAEVQSCPALTGHLPHQFRNQGCHPFPVAPWPRGPPPTSGSYRQVYYWEADSQNETEKMKVLFLPETVLKLKNLTGHTPYRVSISAFNAAGDGPRSDPRQGRTHQAGRRAACSAGAPSPRPRVAEPGWTSGPSLSPQPFAVPSL